MSLFIAGVLMVALSFWYTQYAFADTDEIPPASSDQLATISSNCRQIQSTLQQLSFNDTLARVNQGQLYEEISTDLMAPMNSRIALNHYDGSNLLTTAATYANQIDIFRQSYSAYANALQTVLSNNCKDANKFYTQLMTARQARMELSQTVSDMNESITKYRSQFGDFSDRALGRAIKETN